MMRVFLPFVAALGLVACADEGSANPQQESCIAVEKERTVFRQQVQQKAKKLQEELAIAGSDQKMESYPRLQDSEKLLDFQTEVQAGENKFAVRLRDCAKS